MNTTFIRTCDGGMVNASHIIRLDRPEPECDLEGRPVMLATLVDGSHALIHEATVNVMLSRASC